MSKQLRFKGDSSLNQIKKKKKKITKIHQVKPLWAKTRELEGLVVIYYQKNIINHVGGTGYLSLKDLTTTTEANDDTIIDDTTTLPLPQLASQVFKAHRLPGSKGGILTLKSCFEKYVSVGDLGMVKCDMEAAGGTEGFVGVCDAEGFWSFRG
jgi:hypothetical protein